VHPVGDLTVGLFEEHDKSRFELTAISFGPDDCSDLRRRIKHSFEHFIEVQSHSDQQIAELIQQLEIDIAVDLNGFTQNGRTGIFARRPAPIQVNYLGYPGTMGASYFDYVLTDDTIVPEAYQTYYAERCVWLPNSYQVNDAKRPVSSCTPSRVECELPETGFAFCCFNHTYKITPQVFDIWMRLLQADPSCVLWLRELDAAASENLRREAATRGISPNRLIFAPKIASAADHLARHRLADLFLDTFPYNAHTTGSDALWTGLPVLTILGPTFAGRVAASLLKAVGLPELVTASFEEYETLALRLLRDLSLLESLKARLARNRSKCPLFDTKQSARHIEAAYETMWERYQRGQPPISFAVAAHGSC